MNKAEKRFRRYAMASILVLLLVLLGVINCVNFTMASDDADELTQTISEQNGMFNKPSSSKSATNRPDSSPVPSGKPDSNSTPENEGSIAPENEGSIAPENEGSIAPENEGTIAPTDAGTSPRPESTPSGAAHEPLGRMGPMGPDSPEMHDSLRYFTFGFSENGRKVETVAFRMSAVTEDEAATWAESLLNESTGWTHGTYRYRVYQSRGITYVTVIDQGRELLSVYRILAISGIGALLGLILSYIGLRIAGKRIFEPLEEADYKQKKFIAHADKEFRLPLTIISANVELIEHGHGSNDQTQSIRRQVKKMNALVERLSNLAIFDKESFAPQRTKLALGDVLRASLDQAAERYAAKGLTIDTDISQNLDIEADPQGMKRMMDELVSNALQYAKTHVHFQLSREGERIILLCQNDTDLPQGSYDQVFDRFTTLDNAKDSEHTGLGLAYVKEIVRAHDGRATARVLPDGLFSVRIAL